MKKAILLLLTLHIAPLACSNEPVGTFDPTQRTVRLSLQNLSIEKEEAWIRLFEEIAKKGTKYLEGWETDIKAELSRAQGVSHELLLLRLSAMCSLIASNIDPHLMLDVMPKPLPQIGRYVFGCAVLCGLGYYLYQSYLKPGEAQEVDHTA